MQLPPLGSRVGVHENEYASGTFALKTTPVLVHEVYSRRSADPRSAARAPGAATGGSEGVCMREQDSFE